MMGLYLSGTGNTRHCTELLLKELSLMPLSDGQVLWVPLEDERAGELASEQEFIILAYPTQFSNMPVMVREFIRKNEKIWQGKKVFCMTTMGLFSGDGTGCAARLLKKYGAEIVGGLQVKMPDSICDSKLLKKSREEKQKMIEAADQKILGAAASMMRGNYPREGLGIFSHLAGLFGQRLWFRGKTRDYSDRIKISPDCSGCGICARTCPMNNLRVENGRAQAQGKCTMCYRCVNLCPRRAITLLGKKVTEQYQFEDYGS